MTTPKAALEAARKCIWSGGDSLATVAIIDEALASLQGEDAVERVKALARRFWSIHPSTIAAMNLTREEFYAREMTKLLTTGLVPDEANSDPLDDLVRRFSVALLEKLKAAREKYGYSDEGWRHDDWRAECRRKLLTHVAKGDPRDVAAYCAFMWHHGWSTVAPDEAAIRADEREKCERRVEELDCLYINDERCPFGGIPADPETSIRREAIKECLAAIRSGGGE